MYLIPFGRSYYCKKCKAGFLQVAGRATWILKQPSNARLPQGALIMIGVLIGIIFFYLVMEHSQEPPADGQDVVVVDK